MGDIQDELVINLSSKLDKIMEHLMVLEGRVYPRSEWQIDQSHIFDQMGYLQEQVDQLSKDISDLQLKSLTDKVSSHTTKIEKLEHNLLPWWLLTSGGGLLALAANNLLHSIPGVK